METVSIYPGQRGTVACSLPRVYVDGQRRRDLAATVWEALPAPDFGRAQLELLAGAGGLPPRLEEVGALPPIGSRVLISVNDGASEFRGLVAAHSSQADGQAERLTATVAHELTDILRPVVSSFVQRNADGNLVTLPGAAICFNGPHNGLCTPGPVKVGGRRACVFSTEASARSWTIADALGYLLANHVPAGVETQGLAELESLAGYIDLGVLDITGMTVVEALMEAAKRGGLELRAARQGLGLILYRPGVNGRRAGVRLQQAGSKFSPAASNLSRAGVTIHRRPWLKGVLALGQPKRYESTFFLLPGWDRSLETTRWRDFVRSMSDTWTLRDAVFRKWVLNEHGWYSAPPWGLPTHTFEAISRSDFRLTAPRRLLPCFSANQNQQSLGVVVEVRWDQQHPWHQWRGPLWVSRNECAVYLGGDALGGEFFQAAVQGLAQVRVTATVEADVRIQAQAGGDPGCGVQVADLSARAAWRKVHSTSIFYGAAGLGTPGQRNDQALLQQAATRAREASAQGVQAQLELGWIDAAIQIGNVVNRIDGRNLDLRAGDFHLPSVVSVRHDFLKQSTHLEVRG